MDSIQKANGKQPGKGFTLVELAIVIVIIGLLIGGLLAGRSLVNSATAQNYIKEYQTFKVAADQFEQQFQALPGDFNNAINMIGATKNGNGNRLVDGVEIFSFFEHLRVSGYIPIEDGLHSLTGEPAQQNSKILGKLWWTVKVVESIGTNPEGGPQVHFAWGPVVGSNAADTLNDQYFMVGTYFANHSTVPGGIPVAVARMIDSKSDDGSPNSGKVRGGHYYNSNGFTNWGDCLQALAHLPNYAYNNNSTYGCAMVFRYK